MWVLFPRSASGAWGDFLGAHSCPPTSSHSPWECIYLPLAPCTWFTSWHDPLKGRIYAGGLPEVAWVLHESGYSLLVLEPWPWSHLSLLFITVLRYWGFSRCRPLHSLSYPWVSGGDTVDALTWRRLLLAMPTSWRHPTLATPQVVNSLTFFLGSLEGPHHMLTFDFDFDFGQHPGMGRYKLLLFHDLNIY